MTTTQEHLTQSTPAAFRPYANKVTVRAGRTVNLGNYESARIDVEIEAITPVMDKQNPEPFIRRLYVFLDTIVASFITKDPALAAPPPPAPPLPNLRSELQQRLHPRRPSP